MGDGVSMALGKYLSTKSELDVYNTARDKERFEIVNNRQMEYEETIEILTEQGMKPQDATDYTVILSQYPELWTKWMMDNELEIPDVRGNNALLQGFITLVSFILF